MNNKKVYDVYGQLPIKSNHKITAIENKKSNFTECFILTNTFLQNTKEYAKKSVKKRMNIMTIVLYFVGFAAVLLQAIDLVPGIPDRITFSVIVVSLVAANLLQWRQAITERELNRKSLEEMSKENRSSLEEMVKDHKKELRDIHIHMIDLVKSNQDGIRDLFREINRK